MSALLEGIAQPSVPYVQLNKMTSNIINDKDADGDSLLSFEELGGSEMNFARIDNDEDGLVSQKELNAFFPIHRLESLAASFIADKDTDGDGLLSHAELGGTNERFAGIDLNENGYAESKEINIAFHKLHGNRTGGVNDKIGPLSAYEESATETDGVIDVVA